MPCATPRKSLLVALAPRNEPRHRLPAALDDPRVAIRLPDRPRADHARIAPGGAEVPPVLERKRRIAREGAAGPLRLHQLPQPFAVERRHVRVVSRRAHIDLGIARPAEPLVALRAIGRQINEVGALRPDDVLEQPIDHRVGALEAAGHRRVRVQHDAGDRVQVRLARIARQLDILEAVEREARLVGLALRVAAQDVVVRRARLAQVLGHQPAIGMQHLAVAQANLRARRAFDLQPRHAGEVLAQVEDIDAVGRRSDANGLDLLDRPHRHAGKGFELRRALEPEVHFAAFNLRPFASGRILILVELRLSRCRYPPPGSPPPTCCHRSRAWTSRASPGARHKLRPSGNPPPGSAPPRSPSRTCPSRSVCREPSAYSISSCAISAASCHRYNGRWPQSRCRSAGQSRCSRHTSRRPPRPRGRSRPASPARSRHTFVVGPLVVIRPARRKVGIAHPLAIQVQLIDAQRRRVDRRPPTALAAANSFRYCRAGGRNSGSANGAPASCPGS